MNFHFLSLFRKPADTEVRYVAATKAESEAARAKAIQRRLELAVAVCHLTPSQRTAAIEAGKRGR